MKFRWLFLLLPIFWFGCDEAEEAIDDLCVAELDAMNAASEALDGSVEAMENFCTALYDAIDCADDAGEDVSDLQESYDELCAE